MPSCDGDPWAIDLKAASECSIVPLGREDTNGNVELILLAPQLEDTCCDDSHCINSGGTVSVRRHSRSSRRSTNAGRASGATSLRSPCRTLQDRNRFWPEARDGRTKLRSRGA